VFIAGMLGSWAVIALVVFYGVRLAPVDVAVNLAAFMTLAGWWTERMKR
jgi:hypothetical protein